MHEYAIVAALVDRVADVIASCPGAVARVVHVQVGALAGVEVDLFRTAYETFRARSVCEHAELAIEPVPAEWRCAACERTLDPGAPLRCCARPARLARGDELVLRRVELEVPDV